MPIPTSVKDLSVIDSVNSPQGSDPVGGNLDDFLRALSGIIARAMKKGVDLAPDVNSILQIPVDGTFFNVTGTAAIAGFANTFDGKLVFLRFQDGATLTNSSTLALPGGANYTTFAGEILQFVQVSTGTWTCVARRPSVAVDGSATMTAPLKISDGTNTATYPATGDVTGASIPKGSISAMQADLVAQIGTKQANLGYAPVNKAGDTMTGNLTVGTAVLPTNGNLYMPWAGVNLSDMFTWGRIAARPVNPQVIYLSGEAYSGRGNSSNPTRVPGNYFVTGGAIDGDGGVIGLYSRAAYTPM